MSPGLTPGRPSQLPRPEDDASEGAIAQAIVGFYRLWHGRLRLKGAGYVLRTASNYVRGLQRYPIQVDGIGTLRVDFRDQAGRMWLQRQTGDKFEAFDLETGLFRALCRVLKDGTVFWDVGANVGTVTAYVVTSMPGVRVFAFEPNPFIAQSISDLFASPPRVKTYACALSDKDGEMTLTIPKGKSVGASIEGLDYVLKTTSLTANDVDQVTVPAFAGDSLIRKDPAVFAPDVIKIDVEGHEPAVIRGLGATIAQHRPVIFFEHLYLTDEQVVGLVPDGYSLFSVSNRDGSLTATFDRSVGHNSVLIPSKSHP